MYYSDYNRSPDERETFETSQYRVSDPGPERPHKKSRMGLKITAACLVCALVGGMVGGGGALGEVTVKAVGASVLLHDDFTAADVDADYSVPEQYVLGRPFTARVHFSLRENPLQPTDLGGETLEVTGLPEVLQASTYVPQKSLAPRQSYLGWGVGAAAALLALVLVLRLLRRGSGPKPFKHGKTKPITEADWSIITRQPLPAEDLTPRAKGKPSQGYGQGAGQRPRQ